MNDRPAETLTWGQRGRADFIAGRGYPRDYDGAEQGQQMDYEFGRKLAAEQAAKKAARDAKRRARQTA